MDDKEQIIQAYKTMYEGMINKDEVTLRQALDDRFVLVHMTGMRQNCEEFIKAVLNGTLNYYRARHEAFPVEITGDTAVLDGHSIVEAAVFGGGKNVWHLRQRCTMKHTDGVWKIVKSVAGVY